MNIKVENNKLYVDEKPVLENEHVLQELGYGANAVVFLSYNSLLNREEAIKIWKPRKGHNNVDIKRYLSEIQKNAGFNNDNIAKVYEAGIVNNCYYIKMEYCHGLTLKDYLLNNPSYCERLYVLSNIVSTMYDVYSKGEHHGDLHSRNIMVNNYEVKILDFGTSVFAKEKELSYKRDATMLFDLAIEVLPELKDISFFFDKVRKKTSLEICECIIYLIELLCYEMKDFGDTPYDFYLMNIAIIAKKCDALELSDIRDKYKNLTSIFDYVEKNDYEKNTSYVIDKNKMFLKNVLSNDMQTRQFVQRAREF